MGNVSSGSARFIAWTIVLAAIGVAIYVGCVIVDGPPPPPPPQKVVPRKELVDDIRTLWSFERNYGWRNKYLALSISEMGYGADIGKNGFVTVAKLWDARLDADNVTPEPAKYRIANPSGSGMIETGGYKFGIFPVKSVTGERDKLSAIIVAIPEKASADDSCFVALCGPVNFTNDFSFDLEWPVYELKAAPVAWNALRNPGNQTFGELESRLTSGDLGKFQIRSFRNLYYPGN